MSLVGRGGGLSFLRDELLSQPLQDRYQIVALLPQWSLQTWVIIVLVVLLLAFMEAGYRKGHALQEELERLHTPSVRLDVYKIEENRAASTQTFFLRVRGTSATPSRSKVFLVRAECTKPGTYSLLRYPGSPFSFGVSLGEERLLPVLVYHDTQRQLTVTMPCNIAVAETLQGSEFRLLVCAYGGPTAAELTCRVWIDEGALVVQPEGSDTEYRSEIRHLAHDKWPRRLA